MARACGFDYYNTQTNRYQDIKIKRLKKEFKCNGIAVYDYILCEIYRVRGCFLEWDDSTAFDVADYFDLKETQVIEIVNYCCYVGLFSKELLTRERVLTSLSIQTRFLEMCTRAKRIEAKIPEKIAILPEEMANLPEEVPKTPEEIDKVEYSKVKKSRVKESKVNISFDFFWNEYDKKVGDKDKLEKKWDALTDDERESAVNHIKLYKLATPEKMYRKDPATYLNNKSFNDEIIINARNGNQRTKSAFGTPAGVSSTTADKYL